MAKLRAICIVLVLLACVSISECRTDDNKWHVKDEKKQSEIKHKKITKNVCNLNEEAVCCSKPVQPLVEQGDGGQCNWVAEYKPEPHIHSSVEPKQVAKYKPEPHIHSSVEPKQEKANTGMIAYTLRRISKSLFKICYSITPEYAREKFCK